MLGEISTDSEGGAPSHNSNCCSSVYTTTATSMVNRPFEGIMMFTLRCLWVLAFVIVAIRSDAGVITNGTFEDPTDLTGFSVVGEDFFGDPISAGTVTEPNGAFAQLQNDTATFLLQLQQTFVVPTGASTLSFDFAFSTE